MIGTFAKGIEDPMKPWMLIFWLLANVLLVSAQNTPTPVPTSTATAAVPLSSATATPPLPQQTSATPMLIDPLVGLSVEPPISIDLPQGWGFAYNTFLYTDVTGEVEAIPFAFYQGPVTDGTGSIVLLWGFDSVVNPFSTAAQTGETFPWLDGLRLLRVVILDSTCNIGTSPQTAYSVGELPASGTQFSAIDCPDEQPDTRGWFAALEVDSINFAFYQYIDPLPEPNSAAEQELQAILDSIEFRVEDIQITTEELAATRQALLTALPAVTVTATPEN